MFKALPVHVQIESEFCERLRLSEFSDNRHMNVTRSLALRTGRLYHNHECTFIPLHHVLNIRSKRNAITDLIQIMLPAEILLSIRAVG
jgi:hypothetical protein